MRQFKKEKLVLVKMVAAAIAEKTNHYGSPVDALNATAANRPENSSGHEKCELRELLHSLIKNCLHLISGPLYCRRIQTFSLKTLLFNS